MGFPGGSAGREPACQCRRHKRCGFDAWVRKIPWRRKWQPSPVFLPGKSHGQRSLVGYSPWGRKESDMTECSCTHTYTNIHVHTHTHTHVLPRSKPKSYRQFKELCEDSLPKTPHPLNALTSTCIQAQHTSRSWNCIDSEPLMF